MAAKEINSLEDLFVHGLQDIYYAEKQLLKQLPRMLKNVKDDSLKQGLERHVEETENQVKRLDQVFEMHGLGSRGTKCAGMDGILEEAKETMGKVGDPEVRHSAIIAAAQAAEHYEISRYGTLIALGNELGQSEAVGLLEQSLAEEKAMDEMLTDLAERDINPRAHQASQEGMEDEQQSGSKRRGRSQANGRRKASGSRGRAASASRRKPAAKSSRRGRPPGRTSRSPAKSRSAAKSSGRKRKTGGRRSA